MSTNLPSRASQERPKETALGKEIMRTAAARDDYNNRYLSENLPSGRTPRKFVEDLCKVANIPPPKKNESLAYSIYLVQRDKLKGFEHKDNPTGTDGKCGPKTLAAAFAEYPQLKKAYSKELRAGYFKNQRRDLVKKYNLPEPSSLSSNVEKQPIRHQDAVLLGDSLTHQYARYFYRGTNKFAQLKNVTFHGGKTAYHMQKRYERILHNYNAPAYIEWLGTNDLSYKNWSAEKIYRAKEKIIVQILKQNPNARIITLALLPVMKSKYHKEPERARRIVDYVNRKMRELAEKYPNNITFIDLHSQYTDALQQGAPVFAGDKLHLSVRAAKAIQRMLQDELENGRHSHFLNYM